MGVGEYNVLDRLIESLGQFIFEPPSTGRGRDAIGRLFDLYPSSANERNTVIET